MLIITKSYLQITNKYFLLFKNIDKVHVIRSHAREERLIKWALKQQMNRTAA